MTFPTSPQTLTCEWLSSALNAHVRDFTVAYFAEGAGIMGMVTRLHLDTPDGPDTVIAKFPSPAEENRAVAGVYDMYGRELNFYQRFAPHIELRVPQCYHAEINAESGEFILIMEDLTNFTIGDQVTSCSARQAEMVIEGIANLHASTWNTEEPLLSQNNPAQSAGMQAGFEMGWPVICRQFPELIPAAVADVAATLPTHVPRLLEQMCQAPICAVHGDVRLDNIFFNDNEIALVDWQGFCTSAPEQDLAYFVTQSLSDEVRQSRDWVAFYHQQLTAAGVDYDLQQCRERYRVSALYLLCYATVIAGTLDLGNERGVLLGKTLFGNSMRSLMELEAFDLIG